MRKITRILLGGIGFVAGVTIAGMSVITLDMGNMVGGFGLLIAGTVILMDGLL